MSLKTFPSRPILSFHQPGPGDRTHLSPKPAILRRGLDRGFGIKVGVSGADRITLDDGALREVVPVSERETR